MSRQTIFLSGFILLAACSKAPDIAKRKQQMTEPVQKPAHYTLFAEDHTLNFIDLPMKGDARDQKHFWSGDFWPSKKGSINRRWNAPVRVGFNHRSPTREELLVMPQEKIATLAPTEKYDLLLGSYDYPARIDVSRLAANEEAEVWEGMSNGWAAASVLHVEPQPKTLKNPDGIDIPFGSEDIKGLLAYYYTYYEAPVAEMKIGKPCQMRGCIEDVTAASFHLALANMIGVQKKSFLMDLDRTRDVWNHPVVAYESEYRGNAVLHDKATPGTHSIVRLKTTVTYIDEALNMTWAPVIGTAHQLETRQVYQYWLHLDIDGNVIGGEWKSNERPDYLWTIKAPAGFSGLFSALVALVDDPAPTVITETEPEVTEPEVTEPEVIESEETAEPEIIE